MSATRARWWQQRWWPPSWGSAFCSGLLWLLLSWQSLGAQEPPTRQALLWLWPSLELGLLVPWTGEEFFRTYRLLAQTDDFPTGFSPQSIIGVGLRIRLQPAWYLRLGLESSRLAVDHTYRVSLREAHRQGERIVRARLVVQALPVWLGPEWEPLQLQFSTYLHAALGLVVHTLTWAETIQSSLPADTRTGGLYRDRRFLHPGFRFLVGTLLRFDSASGGSLLESLRFEAAYSFIPLRTELFQTLVAQLPIAPSTLPGPISLSGSALAFRCALVLQAPLFPP